MGFLIRMAITALGLWLAGELVGGITIRGGWTLVWGALLLGFVNAIVRPLAIVLTLPITLLTLGLFLWAINATMLLLVSSFLSGFQIAGFGSALLGSLIIGLTGWIGSAFVGPRGRYEVMVTRREVLRGLPDSDRLE